MTPFVSTPALYSAQGIFVYPNGQTPMDPTMLWSQLPISTEYILTSEFDGAELIKSCEHGRIVQKPDGTKIVEYTTGDVTVHLPSGARIETYRSGDTLTTMPDGTEILTYADGDRRTYTADGSVIDDFKNGDRVTRYADGTELVEFSTGESIQWYGNGVRELKNSDGTILLIHTDKSVSYMDQHGVVTTTAPDGSTTVALPNGSKFTWKDSGELIEEYILEKGRKKIVRTPADAE